LYLSKRKSPLGVFISQSGESSETLWCLERCQEAVAVVNNTESSLAKAMNLKKVVDLYAGKEKMSSTKNYVNTLISLYLGLKINPQKAIQKLRKNFFPLQAEAQEKAQKITRYLKSGKVKGFYVIGSGPNLGTAYEAALTLSETTKLPWNGMSVAQYDHGPKETADNTVVLILNAHGKDERRILLVKDVLRQRSNALVVELNENTLSELISPLTLIVQANFLMNFLADELQVGNTFKLGGKITRVSL
jgi:glucosamine--fructose-6-phosphate aminotransferase (isomerizing)